MGNVHAYNFVTSFLRPFRESGDHVGRRSVQMGTAVEDKYLYLFTSLE